MKQIFSPIVGAVSGAILGPVLGPIRRWPRRATLWLGALAFLVACATGTVPVTPTGGTALSAETATLEAVAADVLVVNVPQGEVNHARQEPYQPQPQDRLETSDFNTWLVRDGQALGTLVGPDRDVLYGFDTYRETPFDAAAAGEANAYRLQSEGDPNYRQPVAPTAVYRKSKPVDTAQTSRGDRRWPMVHKFYLRLPTALAPGQTYELEGLGRPLTLTYQPDRQGSEAVHVSGLGFRPNDPVKVGFLSTWMGTGGGLAYPEGLGFQVIDTATSAVAYSGQARRRYRRDTPEDARGRTYTLTDVDQLDFSELTQPGTYRLCVETVGCSQPFDLAADTWQRAFSVAARGFYHQRSGLALGAPHTDVTRPRPFHPADGLTVYQSTAGLMDTGNGLNAQGTDTSNFANLVAGKTDQVVADAWGGHFDAGDWDRRVQHLDVARWLLELLEQFPDGLADLALNLPESGNGLPDLLNEALWGVDFYKRLQTPAGGIRGGIESEEHPRRGEASWQESLTVMAYAPDPWSSYIYAGVAAHTAHLLTTYAPDRASDYRTSALAAMDWAEAQHRTGIEALDWARGRIELERALAALELYKLTGDRPWHDTFLAAWAGVTQELKDDWRLAHTQREIAWLYSQLPGVAVDAALRQELRAAIIAEAEAAVDTGQSTGFGWTKTTPWTPVGWGDGLGAPKVRTLLRAHALTGNDQYLNAALLGCQFAAGANPDNLTYTTGLGHQYPQNPLIMDQRITGQTIPGITVYGPIDPDFYKGEWMFDVLDSVTVPPARQWPAVETYFDVYFVPAVNEFTVTQSMADTAYAWGYLAGLGFQG